MPKNNSLIIDQNNVTNLLEAEVILIDIDLKHFDKNFRNAGVQLIIKSCVENNGRILTKGRWMYKWDVRCRKNKIRRQSQCKCGGLERILFSMNDIQFIWVTFFALKTGSFGHKFCKWQGTVILHRKSPCGQISCSCKCLLIGCVSMDINGGLADFEATIFARLINRKLIETLCHKGSFQLHQNKQTNGAEVAASAKSALALFLNGNKLLLDRALCHDFICQLGAKKLGSLSPQPCCASKWPSGWGWPRVLCIHHLSTVAPKCGSPNDTTIKWSTNNWSINLSARTSCCSTTHKNEIGMFYQHVSPIRMQEKTPSVSLFTKRVLPVRTRTRAKGDRFLDGVSIFHACTTKPLARLSGCHGFIVELRIIGQGIRCARNRAPCSSSAERHLAATPQRAHYMYTWKLIC